MKKKLVKLNRIEKALIILAIHIDKCPYNDYKVAEEVWEELGYERK